jgi:hypothetical protein
VTRFAQLRFQPQPTQPFEDGAHYPSGIEKRSAVIPCREGSESDAGKHLHDAFMARTVSDAEVLDHVEHCAHLTELAYERFQATQDPAFRDEALEWATRRNEAMAALSPQYRAAREAEILRAIDEGVDYFSHQGELARQQLTRGSA